jgi:hypothetical protein
MLGVPTHHGISRLGEEIPSLLFRAFRVTLNKPSLLDFPLALVHLQHRSGNFNKRIEIRGKNCLAHKVN